MKLGQKLCIGDVIRSHVGELPQDRDEAIGQVSTWVVAKGNSEALELLRIDNSIGSSYRTVMPIEPNKSYAETMDEALTVAITQWRSNATKLIRAADAVESND